MLESALQIGSSAQELDFVSRELLFSRRAPFDPVMANVFRFP